MIIVVSPNNPFNQQYSLQYIDIYARQGVNNGNEI